MEPAEVIIARLVLGYLKEENCKVAHKEFAKSSQHLQQVLRSKFQPTRFVGLTLADILNDYFEISRIVQGRLESTNYYNEGHTGSSLVQQLLYLLSNRHSSRTSTPCPSYCRSPVESNRGESSSSHVDHISDVETTPAHSLPGNVRRHSEDLHLYKTPRRKSNSKLSKSATETSLQTFEKEDMSEVLAQTLLENKEFHEKIAHTINKVAEKQYRVSSELDKTIKTVVRETEADPIFDKILEEIIGSTSIIESDKMNEASGTASSLAKDVRDDTGSKSKKTQKRLDHFVEEETYTTVHRVDQQNDEAVQSIVANSKMKSVPESKEDVQINTEVEFFDGSLDKYLTTNTCNANTQTQPLLNPMCVNTIGSLFVVVSNPQPLNWNVVPAKPLNTITEQDILAMPTVIVNDEKQDKVTSQTTSQSSSSTTTTTTTSKPKPGLKPLIPKPMIEIPAKYYNMYNGNNAPQNNGLKKVIYPKTAKNDAPKERSLDVICDTESTKETEEDVEINSITSDKLSEPCDVKVVGSNEQSTPASKIENLQKTPKTGSHIRNLDFSSPPKITSTHRKLNKNKVDTMATNKSSAVNKKKQSQNSVPSCKAEDPSESNNDVKTDSKEWDSDLRINLPNLNETPEKKKKKAYVKKGRAKKQKPLEVQLNTTEHDAALIEAALHTPIKSENNKECENNPKSNSKKTERSKIKDEIDIVETDIQIKNDPDSNKGSNENAINKTVLSPSKLNANKRKLVNLKEDTNLMDTSAKSVDGTMTFITPEMVQTSDSHPIKANRNITIMFETPLKCDFIPKTPGIQSPNATLNTPFTKMLEANLKDIDISTLTMPNIPITPSFPPYTPNVEGSTPYSSRRTDYSTSSSYYQPSDNELNRSLEVNVIESERQSVEVITNIVIKKNIEGVEEANFKKAESKTTPTVNEHLNIFNKNIIGKKNLNLVKRSVSSSSNSSADSSSESSTEEGESLNDSAEKSNETVIHKKTTETPKRVYSLRNRTISKKEDVKPPESKATTNKKQNKNVKTSRTSRSRSNSSTAKHETTELQVNSKIEEIVDSVKKELENETLVEEEPLNTIDKEIELQQAKLKKELSEKLSRTLSKIKAVEKPSTKRKTTTGKFVKIKLANAQKTKRKPKTTSTKKSKELDNENNKSHCDIKPSDSSDTNKTKDTKKKASCTQIVKDLEKHDNKSSSDIEAQNLIEGLKERGIHLMKNKSSPSKKSNEVSNISEPETEKQDNEGNSTLETPHETSTSEIKTELREIYDTKIFEQENVHIVFDESKKMNKSFEDYNTKILEKTFIGKIFIEEIDDEIEVPVVLTPFITLLDIPSIKNSAQKQSKVVSKAKGGDKKTQGKIVKADPSKDCTDTQNAAKEDNLVRPRRESTEKEQPSTKKRKIEKEECRVPQVTECKNLLQQINVDTFLNNIYGKS